MWQRPCWLSVAHLKYRWTFKGCRWHCGRRCWCWSKGGVCLNLESRVMQARRGRGWIGARCVSLTQAIVKASRWASRQAIAGTDAPLLDCNIWRNHTRNRHSMIQGLISSHQRNLLRQPCVAPEIVGLLLSEGLTNGLILGWCEDPSAW